MAGKKIRLFKIASEINIGKEAIVEFLQGKGFDIQNKPTAVLTEDMVDAIYDKFKKEKRAAEVQREKVQKHKDIRKQNVEKQKQETEPEVEAALVPETPATESEPEVATQEEEVVKSVESSEPETINDTEAVEEVSETESVEETPATPEVSDESDTSEDSSQNEESEPEAEVEVKSESESKSEPEVEAEPEHIDKRQKLSGLKVVGKMDVIPVDDNNKDRRKNKDDKKKGQKNKKGETEVIEGETKLKKRKNKRKQVVDIQATISQTDESGTKKKRKKKRSIREQISEEDVAKAIKQTLAGMEDSQGASARAKARQKKKEEKEIKDQIEQEEREKESAIIKLTEFVTTQDLANLMNIGTNEIILKCMELGLMVTINQRLDKDTIQLIASDYDYEVEFQDQKDVAVIEDEEDPEESLRPRSPIVTIMGHVDHGKTSLLDYIRNEKVVAGESGGITQHVGAYHVDVSDGKFVTFLDTPGHEAFTAMRARGAQITDVVVLVCAADDNVMPQTIEAINHAKAAGVPIVVAINKIDKPEANPDKVKQQLSEHDLLVEEWGGKVQSVEISAKTGQNIDNLLEALLLEAEILELKANPDRSARGHVVEAHMEQGLGSVSTVVVQKGTLNVGDIFVAGTAYGKVRAMFDERGNKIENAGPSTPVKITGFDVVPGAGDNFIVTNSESQARTIANERKQLKREQELRQIRHVTLDDLSKEIALGGVSDLKIILKADVGGSLEALSDELLKLSHDEVRVVILHKGVGQITESDVQLAAASDAIILGFHTSPTAKARKLADNESIEIRDYEIIYEVIDDVRNALEGMLRPDVSQEIVGEAEIREIFKIGRVNKIAGCKVISGKIHRNDRVKVLRDGLPVYEGKIGSLKREKDDAKEVSEGYECGIVVDGFNDIMKEDIIQAIKTIETKRTLEKSR